MTVALADQALTAAELAAEVGASKATVSLALRRLLAAGRVVLVDQTRPDGLGLASP